VFAGVAARARLGPLRLREGFELGRWRPGGRHGRRSSADVPNCLASVAEAHDRWGSAHV